MTTARAGLLLCDDLAAAERMLKVEGLGADLEARVDDLIVFYAGDRLSRIRKQIGIAVA